MSSQCEQVSSNVQTITIQITTPDDQALVGIDPSYDPSTSDFTTNYFTLSTQSYPYQNNNVVAVGTLTSKESNLEYNVIDKSFNNYTINATLTICQNICGCTLIGSQIPPITFNNSSQTDNPSKATLNLQTKQLQFFDNDVENPLASLFLSITYSQIGNCIYAWVRNDITQALSFTEGADPETDPPS